MCLHLNGDNDNWLDGESHEVLHSSERKESAAASIYALHVKAKHMRRQHYICQVGEETDLAVIEQLSSIYGDLYGDKMRSTRAFVEPSLSFSPYTQN